MTDCLGLMASCTLGGHGVTAQNRASQLRLLFIDNEANSGDDPALAHRDERHARTRALSRMFNEPKCTHPTATVARGLPLLALSLLSGRDFKYCHKTRLHISPRKYKAHAVLVEPANAVVGVCACAAQQRSCLFTSTTNHYMSASHQRKRFRSHTISSPVLSRRHHHSSSSSTSVATACAVSSRRKVVQQELLWAEQLHVVCLRQFPTSAFRALDCDKPECTVDECSAVFL
jgi:hypothetical protein